MGWIPGLFRFLPYLVASCVLGGIAIAAWRRTRTTGALLIAIACGVRVVHESAGIYYMWRLVSDSVSRASVYMTLYSAFQSAGAITADVLLIVGVALVLRRVAPAHAGRSEEHTSE